jgi:predicted ATP-grasp superfamily ATP-dependent carboligase
MSRLLIVGASARAAAMSAVRAGFAPWCSDLFADLDLRAIVPCIVRCPIHQYPSAFSEILRSAPEAPWMYTGGLENHLNLIRTMAQIRPLWGNGPDALAKARSPFTIERALRDAGLPALEVRAAEGTLPADCRWLRKPLAGSAGHGIQFADEACHASSDRHYFQRYVEGVSLSALFVRSRDRVQMLGITEQLIGTRWLNAPPFRYAGNIGPIELPGPARETVTSIGTEIGERCGLLGLFGIDFVLEGDIPWLVEVNPRYPASVEVLEMSTGLSALALHRMAFDPTASSAIPYGGSGLVCGKAIVYAAERIRAPACTVEDLVARGLLRTDARAGTLADIPVPGSVIEPDWPVLTLFAEGKSRAECANRLRQRSVEFMRNLDNH